MTEGLRIDRPAYRIECERIALRCYDLGDARALRDALAESRDVLLPWLPWAESEPQELDDKLERLRRFRSDFDRGEGLGYGIFTGPGKPEPGRLLGGIGLMRPSAPGVWEVGYWLRRGEWSRGYMAEATAGLVRTCFEGYGLRRLELMLHPDNARSRRIPERLGFRLDGLRRGFQPPAAPGGPGTDVEVWSLLAAEYPDSPAASCKVRALDGLGRPLVGLG